MIPCTDRIRGWHIPASLRFALLIGVLTIARPGQESTAQGSETGIHVAPATALDTGIATQAVVEVSPTGAVSSIADGIRLVRPGGRVVVHAGTYREPMIVIDRPMVLEGEGWPTVDGEGDRELIRIRASGVTVRGLRLTRVGASMTEDRAAIRAMEVRDCTIVGNRFDDTYYGVYLQSTEGCSVTDNDFAGIPHASEALTGNAIHLWSTRDVEIARNRISGHRDGIYFEFVRNAVVSENVSEQNMRYGLHFMFSDSCRYDRNIFRHNGSGVAVMYTNVVTMTDNQFADNRGGAAYGLLLKEIADPVLIGNSFVGNTVALMADGATRLIVERNRFTDNGWGVRLMSSVQDGRFTSNDFSGNTFDVSTNGGSGLSAKFDGNWFADYRGYDLDRDGFGDVPHRPVRLFSILVARYETMLVLQRSLFVGLLDAAERALPSLTPAALVDPRPAMRPVAGEPTAGRSAESALRSTRVHSQPSPRAAG